MKGKLTNDLRTPHGTAPSRFLRPVSHRESRHYWLTDKSHCTSTSIIEKRIEKLSLALTRRVFYRGKDKILRGRAQHREMSCTGGGKKRCGSRRYRSRVSYRVLPHPSLDPKKPRFARVFQRQIDRVAVSCSFENRAWRYTYCANA